MESFFSRYKNALVLMLVVLAQVVLLAMQVRRPAPGMPDGHNVRLWRYMVAAVVTPPERLAHNIGLNVRGVWSNYVYLRHLKEQNQSLQVENDRLRLEQASLAEDARTGQRLREMLDFRGRYIDKTIPAQVIGTSGTDQARVIYIDKGSKDGLRVQMPVITPGGIVGKIKNVFPGTAQVLLISDQTSGTGVALETTRIRGVMKGNASGQPQMINISPDERIQPGEPVVTSGGDQVYPPGMPVGVVDHVVADPETSYVNVVVKPNADLARLEEVLVVIEFSDKMPFAQERDIVQSEALAQAQKQRAADILSDRLPSLHDPNAPESKDTDDDTDNGATASADSGDPARPVRPPAALHPDRYTPGAAPPAESLIPGAGPPMAHRQLSGEGTAPAASGSTRSAPNTAESSTQTDRAAIPSRFPVKPMPLAPSGTTTAETAGAAASTGSSPVKTAKPTGTGISTATSGTNTGGLTAPHVPSASASGVSAPRSAVAGGSSPAAVPTVRPAPKPASASATSSGVSGQVRPSASTPSGQVRPPASAAAGEQPATPAPQRKIEAPADSGGGILTPAGMGSIGAPARKPAPKPSTQAPAAKPSATAPPGGA